MEERRIDSTSVLSSCGSSTSLEASSAKMEEHTFNDWTVRCRVSHILPSKCSSSCRENELCIFCRYTKQLDVPHLPEMVFPFNVLELEHKSGCQVQFTAFEALKLVKKENFNVKIACSESWKKSREDSGIVEQKAGDFDWTFRTDYNGTYNGWSNGRQVSDTGIDLEVLKKREQILLYKDLMLFEDELHDNGVAVCNVRMRVMPSGFFVLLRYFLRIDGVLIAANDTRIYHEFSTNHVLVETAQREDKVDDLQVPLGMMTEPDEITSRLTLRKSTCEKLILPS
ncbi:hypothetical protein GE061_006553 [Apolygus lucorum]|uniref:TIP41-like protein n=1 Tax=Apolygus lucorum TaxID=248454 RepID=A0A6A4J5M3_APOLU|nr:hypothetical protein GE061_006553 [Apolygus lucorum]